MTISIDSSRLTPAQNYRGLNQVVYTSKATLPHLENILHDLRKAGLYEYSDRLREQLLKIDHALSYYGEYYK